MMSPPRCRESLLCVGEPARFWEVPMGGATGRCHCVCCRKGGAFQSAHPVGALGRQRLSRVPPVCATGVLSISIVLKESNHGMTSRFELHPKEFTRPSGVKQLEPKPTGFVAYGSPSRPRSASSSDEFWRNDWCALFVFCALENVS